ncbi:hypothetical protein ACJMK2_017330 [Sinanodonta woodiana]|uniref:Uncharacterized protein n=1 Tax=Sinanodonta woodiana TaxID=1069815 RepID=A0ABD3UWK1_SINWO
MDSSDIEHVTEPRDATVSRSLDISISNSPIGFSFDNEAIETLDLADILLNSEPNKPKDLCLSEDAVTDHNSDSLNIKSLSFDENQIIISSEDSDCSESAFIPSEKSSMSGSNKSGKKESVPVMEQKQDKVQISVATDKNSADIDEMSPSSSGNTEITEKCISKSSFLGITKSTKDNDFDEKIIINDKEGVNNGDKRKIQEEQDKQGKEGKSCSGKLGKSHKVVDTMYGSLEKAGSFLEACGMDDQNSSCAEKIAELQEKTLSSDMCLSMNEVTDSNKQPTQVDSSDFQPGSSQLTNNEMEENDQGHSLTGAVGRDHDTEKVSASKQKRREIKQPIIKLADFMLNTSSKTNPEDKKLPNKSKRSWSVKLMAPASSLSKKRIRKEDKEEKITFEEQVSQSIFSEKSRNEKSFLEAETVQVNVSKKKQKAADLRQLENMNEAPALLADDCNSDRLNTKDEVSVKAKVGFSLNGVLSESVSVKSIVSSSSSCTQQHADLNGEENNVDNYDAVNRNMQDESDVQLYSNFQSHHPGSSKHSTPTTKRKIATNTLDLVPIDGKIPTIKLHRMNHPGHLSSHSQTVHENKMAKLRTKDTPGCSGSYDNTQSQHGTQSQTEKRRIPKHSAALGKRNRDVQISDPVSVDGKVPIIKLQRINSLEKQEKGDMPLNMNSLKEPSDSKLRKTNLCPNKGKRKEEKKNPSPCKQSGIDFETSCFESEEEDNIVSKDLLDSLLEKVTADYSLMFGSELNISKEDNKTDGDCIQVMNVESGGLTGALGGPLANMSPIAGPSLLGQSHCFNYVSEQQSSRKIKSDTDLQKKKSDTDKKVRITKRQKTCSSDSNHCNSLQKTMAVKENFNHEQQDVTCNDNSKDLLPKEADGVDPEVEKLIRKLKSSDYRKRKNLEPVVLLTRIDDEDINLIDTSLKGYDLNFSQKKRTDSFAQQHNEKNESSQRQMEFRSPCDSSRRLVVPLERLDSPIKTGNTSRQSVDKKCVKKSSFVNGKHEESIKVEVHASWFEMDNDISGGNIKSKERNSPFKSSSSPVKKVRKDPELNNEVLGTVTEKPNTKTPDSAGVKRKNIHEQVLKPDNMPVNCATCAYLSSPDSRHVKEAYAGKGILNRHVIVAIQRLDSEIDCASVSSLNIKEDRVDQRKKQAKEKKKLKHKKEKHVHCLTEAELDSKSNEMKSMSESDEAWKSNIQCEAGTSGLEKEDAKSLVVKISKVLTKKDSGFKGTSLPKGKCDNQGKDVHLSSEVRVKLEKLDMENTPPPFFSKITHQDSSFVNPETSNGEIDPSSNVLTKDKSEVHCVTTDSGKLLSNQCTGPSGKKSCNTGETLNSSSDLLQQPDDDEDADEITDSNSNNRSGVISLPGNDAELTKTREKSAVRSDQKTRDKGLIPVDSEPESDGAASPFPEPLVDENVNDLAYDINTNTDFNGTEHDEPLIKREKEITSCQLVPETPNVHRSPSDPWPKLSRVTDTMDKSDSSEDTDVSSTLSPQDTNQRKKLLEAYKRRLDTIQDKDYEYENPEPVKKSETRRSLSFSDEGGEEYTIRPGVIILDPR